MKKFSTEISNGVANASHCSLNPQKIVEKSLLSKSEVTKKLMYGPKKKVLAQSLREKTTVEREVENNISVGSQRIKRSFEEKHNDSEIINFLNKKNDSQYTVSGIDNAKDVISTELINLRTILEDKNLLQNAIFLSKEIALFYTAEISATGENRGNVYDKKCEMFSDNYKRDPNFHNYNDLSADNLSKNINIRSSRFEPLIVLHSKLKIPNSESYKHSNEVIVAKQISAETGNEIFVSGDCDSNDPELLEWLGNLTVSKPKESSEQGQTNLDIYQKIKGANGKVEVVRGGDIKHKAAPKILQNEQLGVNEKPYDLYVSAGSVEPENQTKIIRNVSDNVLKKKLTEYVVMSSDPRVKAEDLREKYKEIIALQKYKATQKLDSLNEVSSSVKVIFNKSNASLKVSDSENIVTPILND